MRLNERKTTQDIKKVAYLVDAQTINVLDLNTGVNVASVGHDVRVDWLEVKTKKKHKKISFFLFALFGMYSMTPALSLFWNSYQAKRISYYSEIRNDNSILWMWIRERELRFWGFVVTFR